EVGPGDASEYGLVRRPPATAVRAFSGPVAPPSGGAPALLHAGRLPRLRARPRIPDPIAPRSDGPAGTDGLVPRLVRAAGRLRAGSDDDASFGERRRAVSRCKWVSNGRHVTSPVAGTPAARGSTRSRRPWR